MNSENYKLADFLTKNDLKFEDVDIIGNKSISDITSEQYEPGNNKKYILLKKYNELYEIEKIYRSIYGYTLNYKLIDTINDVIDYKNISYGIHCELYTDRTMHLSKDPTIVNFNSLKYFNSKIFNNKNGQLTVKSEGVYQIICSITGNISANFVSDIIAQLYHNEDKTNIKSMCQSSTSTVNYISMTLSGLLYLHENDTIKLLLNHINEIPFGVVILEENNISLSLVKLS